MTAVGVYLSPLQKSIAAIALSTAHVYPVLNVGWSWIPQSLLVTLVTTATVGNRQLELQVKDPAGNVAFRMVAGATQAASLTRKYQFALNLTDLTAFRDTDFLCSALPEIALPTGWTIGVIDNKAVDTAADTAASFLFVNQIPNP